jgi:hypothetical protein
VEFPEFLKLISDTIQAHRYGDGSGDNNCDGDGNGDHPGHHVPS